MENIVFIFDSKEYTFTIETDEKEAQKRESEFCHWAQINNKAENVYRTYPGSVRRFLWKANEQGLINKKINFFALNNTNIECLKLIHKKCEKNQDEKWYKINEACQHQAPHAMIPHYIEFLNQNNETNKYKNIKNETIEIIDIPRRDEKDMNNIIYYGVPGTGKTYRIQQDYINNAEKKANTITTTFHQSFGYEEFVEGIKSKVNNQSHQVEYQVEKGIFYKACENAAKLAGFDSLTDLINSSEKDEKVQEAIEKGKILYFCIDEINRGNIASIFGELISLIEPSKRIGANTNSEMTVTLPYSGDIFGVPANLKIIGTMNTADRSIQLLDSALRRRFKFVECNPDYSVIPYPPAQTILRKINNRIRALLGKDYQIGHAYFIDAKTDLDIFTCLRDKIIPLLEEYFYGETEKIRVVLNENESSSKENCFYVLDDDAADSISNYDNSINIYKLNSYIANIDNNSEAKEFIRNI